MDIFAIIAGQDSLSNADIVLRMFRTLHLVIYKLSNHSIDHEVKHQCKIMVLRVDILYVPYDTLSYYLTKLSALFTMK